MRQLLSDLRSLSRRARYTLVAVLLLFNVIAVCRLVPVNQTIADNESQEMGDLDRRVERIYHKARERAQSPFFDVSERVLFHGRNPGLFMAPAEFAIRAGADGPLPIQLGCLVLWNLGLVLLAAWCRATFGSDVAAVAAVVFESSRPFFIYVSSSIHADPYVFVFSQAALYAATVYLRTSQRSWYLGAALAYFLACQNYWMYYVSNFLLLAALCWRFGRPMWRTLRGWGAAAVASAGFTVLNLLNHLGWSDTWRRLLDIALARTGDWRTEGSQWKPNDVYVTSEHLERYHEIVADRVEVSMGLPLWLLLLVCVVPFVLSRSFRKYRWLSLVLAAALSWNLLMVQHTVIHGFSGMYGHIAWTTIVAAGAAEAERVLANYDRRWLSSVCLIGALFTAYTRPYAVRLEQYVRNIVAGEVVAGESDRAIHKKQRRIQRVSQATFDQRRAAVGQCAALPGVRRSRVRFRVARSGVVESAKVEPRGTPFAKCVENVAKETRFAFSLEPLTFTLRVPVEVKR